MKNLIKSICFIIIFIIISSIYMFLVIPKYNMDKYNILDIAEYEILEEKKNTIDTLFVGDSLVYSAISPMEIWDEYGFTSFDCSTPAQLIETSYKYIKNAIDTQHPKIIFLEANVIFRDASKRTKERKIDDFINRYIFLSDYHDNWKNIFFGEDIININKGYVFIKKVKRAPKEINYMKKTNNKVTIPKENYEYLDKIVELCNENEIKLILISIPSMKSWDYTKVEFTKEIASKYNLVYIDFNEDNPLKINWEKETKDEGSHLNYIGAKKVSHYLGNYIKELNLVNNHKEDSKYSSWNLSYKKYKKLNNFD